MELLYLVFARMPGESYRSRLRSLLVRLCDVFQAVMSSLVCWFWRQKDITGGSSHKYFCRDKRRVLSRQTRVCRDRTRLLSRQRYTCRKKTFVARKLCLSLQNICRDKNFSQQTRVCRDKHIFVATKDLFVATKMILVAVAANDRKRGKEHALLWGDPEGVQLDVSDGRCLAQNLGEGHLSYLLQLDCTHTHTHNTHTHTHTHTHTDCWKKGWFRLEYLDIYIACSSSHAGHPIVLQVVRIPERAFSHLPKLGQLELSGATYRQWRTTPLWTCPNSRTLFLNNNLDLTAVPKNLPAASTSSTCRYVHWLDGLLESRDGSIGPGD